MKKKLLLLILPLLMMCLLTGCGERIGIYYSFRNMPENSHINLLLKIESDEPLNPKYSTDTEISRYSEDGWYSGYYYVDGVSASSGVFSFEEKGKDIRPDKIAQKYKSIKIAVTDKDGKILQVSPEFSLKVEGKKRCWEKICYDYADNKITGLEDTEYNENLFGADWEELEFDAMVIAAFFNWLFMMVVLSMKKNWFSQSFPLISFLSFIPNCFYALCLNVLYFGDYISWFYAHFLLFFFGVFVFFTVWGWKIYYRLRREENNNNEK